MSSNVDNSICFATHHEEGRIHATALAQRARQQRRILGGRRASRGSITTRRARTEQRADKITSVQLEQFGFFSGLRANSRGRIMLVRFDLTVLIGTWLHDPNTKVFIGRSLIGSLTPMGRLRGRWSQLVAPLE